MSSDVLIAQYPKQVCVRDRNYSSLLRWAAYTTAVAIPPTKPDQSWVEMRLVAERMADQIDSYTQRTLAWFMMDPAITEAIHDWLNPYGDPDTEVQLSDRNSAIIGGFMPRFAATDVSDQQVQDWYTAHGFV